MADSYLIRLDLERVRHSYAEDRPLPSYAELLDILEEEAELIPRPDLGPDWFLAEDISLEWFDPEEILERRPYA